MKSLRITNSLKKALVDDEDFDKIQSSKWYANSRGSTLLATINNKKINMPNLIFNDNLMYDHIDKNPFNNQKSNLRVATNMQNSRNTNKTKYKRSSIYKGVSLDSSKNLWKAQICIKYKNISLGYFTDEKQAARAYDRAALKYFKEFAVLNFPTCQEST